MTGRTGRKDIHKNQVFPYLLLPSHFNFHQPPHAIFSNSPYFQTPSSHFYPLKTFEKSFFFLNSQIFIKSFFDLNEMLAKFGRKWIEINEKQGFKPEPGGYVASTSRRWHIHRIHKWRLS